MTQEEIKKITYKQWMLILICFSIPQLFLLPRIATQPVDEVGIFVHALAAIFISADLLVALVGLCLIFNWLWNILK